MALEQLSIAQNIVVVGFGIMFGGIVMAAAIAFGLGAKDLAKEFLEQRLSNKSRDRAPDLPPSPRTTVPVPTAVRARNQPKHGLGSLRPP